MVSAERRLGEWPLNGPAATCRTINQRLFKPLCYEYYT